MSYSMICADNTKYICCESLTIVTDQDSLGERGPVTNAPSHLLSTQKQTLDLPKNLF